MTQKRQRKRCADAKSWNPHGIGRLRRSDNARGLNVDEVAAVLAVGDAHSKHVGFVNQLHLSHIGDDHQTEVLPRDVRLTHIYQEVEEVEGLYVEGGLALGHRHAPALDPLFSLLQTAIANVLAVAQGLCLSKD